MTEARNTRIPTLGQYQSPGIIDVFRGLPTAWERAPTAVKGAVFISSLIVIGLVSWGIKTAINSYYSLHN